MNESLVNTLENSRHYTLAVANAMPEDQYGFKPAGAGWNFGELLDHISYGVTWWHANYVKGMNSDWNPPAVKTKKSDVIKRLNDVYDELQKWLKQNELSDRAVKGFHATIDHITHHRGQAVMYLRFNKIVPPDYTY